MTTLRRLITVTSHLTRPSTTALYTSTSAKVGSAFSTKPPADMSEVKQLVDSLIAENNVVVLGKSWCVYSRRAVQILKAETDKVKVLEMDKTDSETQIQSYLHQLNGQDMVPHVYLNHKFVGGCSDLQAIPKAELKKRIAASA